MIHDLVIDTLFEENVTGVLASIGGRLVMDSEDPEAPYLTPDDGYLVVRLKDGDPIAFARELERRVSSMTVVAVINRTPGEKPETGSVPGSFADQRSHGLL